MNRLRMLGIGALVALLPLLPASADAAPGDPVLGYGYLGGTRTGADWLSDITAASDGAVYVIDTVENADIRRILPSGALDAGFGTGGAVSIRATAAEGPFRAAVADGTGLLLLSQRGDDRTHVIVRRLRSTGAADTTYGTAGRTDVPLVGGAPGDPVDLAVDGQGRALVLTNHQVTRLLPSGAIDATYGTAGSTIPPVGPLTAFGVGRDGAASVLENPLTSASSARVAHLGAGGGVDRTWGRDGIATLQTGFELSAIAIAPDGSTVLGGRHPEPSGPGARALIVRLTPTGAADPTFGFGGYAAPLVRCGIEQVADVRVGDDGGILAVGITGNARAFVARYAGNGLLDPTFGNGGWRFSGYEPATADLGTFVVPTVALDLQPGNRVVVGRPGPGTVRAYDLAGTGPTPARPPVDTGYWTVTGNGVVQGHGAVDPCGSATIGVVGGASTTNPDGYWLVGPTGRVQSFGKAPDLGSYTGRLNQPMLGMAALATDDGYWLLARDGGIFSYGAARFYGSTGNRRLNKPIFSMAATAGGKGYWLVASDGGVFSFGDAKFYGSTGSLRLRQPIVGMARTPSGRGYWMVEADGTVFPFGDAGNFGNAVGRGRTIVGITPTSSGQGYWLLARDGTVFNFGDAVQAGNGSPGSVVLLHE